MKSYEASSEIAAPPEAIWRVLTDGASYSNWDSGVMRVGTPLGLFKGVRTFTLSPAGDGRTHFRVREEYTGPLLGMMWRSMPDLGPSFDKFAEGLKRRVETGAP
jgi:hypothetical protein